MSTTDTRPSPEFWSLYGGNVGPFVTPYDRGCDPGMSIVNGMSQREEKNNISVYSRGEV